MRLRLSSCFATLLLCVATVTPVHAAPPVLGGPLPGPLPLFPASNWWNLDITSAPVDSNSANFISFIGGTQGLHPDFGGDVGPPGSPEIYGFPYIVVDSTQAKRTVTFQYFDESDGVDHTTETSFPFYPIPDQAITQARWIEEGFPGNVDRRDDSDRHILIVDKDNKHLYELYNVFYDGASWQAGSGAFFDMNTNNRRPEGWTSADAAGLAILPGLLRYDEFVGPAEIGHALRVTLRASNGHVYPASHTAGSNPSALPMGARLRLKANKDISSFPADIQRVFRAMKKYGLIMADNGSDMFISGTYDTRWDNDVLNPAFGALTAGDFDVIQLGFVGPPQLSIDDRAVAEGTAVNASFRVVLASPSTQTVTVNYATVNGTAVAGSDFTATSGVLTFTPGRTTHSLYVPILADSTAEGTETFSVQLSNPTNAALGTGLATGTILDPPGAANVPMYRAYNPTAIYHFFTTSLPEFNNAVANGYNDESNPPCCSIPFSVPNVAQPGAVALNRMYNPNSGRHYYTANAAERDSLMGIGWVYEKDEGFIYAAAEPGTTTIYRLYNNISGVHLYTASAGEKDQILAAFQGIWFEHTPLGFAFP